MASEKDKELAEDPKEAIPMADTNDAEDEPVVIAPDNVEQHDTAGDTESFFEHDGADLTPKKTGSRVLVPAVVGAVAAIVLAVAFVGYETRPGGLLGRDTEAIDGLSASVEALEAQFANSKKENAELSRKLEEQEVLISGLVQRLGSTEQQISQTVQLQDAVSVLETRLTDLENRPLPEIGATKEAVDAYEAQLAAMRAMLGQELARIEEQAQQSAVWRDDAAGLQRQAELADLTSRLLKAIQSGDTFDPILKEIADLGVEIPSDLAAVSAGVSSVTELSDAFPEIARQAVEQDIREKLASGEVGRLEGFLRLQLGARSTAPKAGDSTEAIMARAEAALGKNDLQSAVAELAPLKASAYPNVFDWLERANAHLSATNAATNLLNSNK